jgi:hypothetical protein
MNVPHWGSTPFLEGTRVETANVGMFHHVEWGNSIRERKCLQVVFNPLTFVLD